MQAFNVGVKYQSCFSPKHGFSLFFLTRSNIWCACLFKGRTSSRFFVRCIYFLWQLKGALLCFGKPNAGTSVLTSHKICLFKKKSIALYSTVVVPLVFWTEGSPAFKHTAEERFFILRGHNVVLARLNAPKMNFHDVERCCFIVPGELWNDIKAEIYLGKKKKKKKQTCSHDDLFIYSGRHTGGQ